jgi:putative membrane protein
MYYDGGDHMGAGGWVFMALLGVALIGLLVAFIVWLMQDQRRRPHGSHYVSGGSAIEILDRRLATGEISVQEYERLKASLSAPLASSAPPIEPPTAPQT